MTITFRADADVTNGTAGTSVVVARPAGTTTGDVLIAFIAATGVPSITAPSGWTLIGTQDASTAVRIAAYRKVASSEPASWTWTLGSSQRAWGWVGAYEGVDTTNPVIDAVGTADTTVGTSFFPDTATVTTGSLGVSGVAAVRAADGGATTWSVTGTERADLTSNGGSGTDIAGCMTDLTYLGVDPANHGPIWTANQSQTAAAMWVITLQPAFVQFDGGIPAPIVEVAWGADPDGDPEDWVWTDISTHVKANPGILITKGLQPDSRAPLAPPTSVTLSLLNPRGDYTPDNPLSSNWPYVVADTPLRVSVPYGYAPPTERATVFVESWTPGWDVSTADAVVEVQAFGRLHRIGTINAPVESALRRALGGNAPVSGVRPQSYWPMEEESRAGQAAEFFGGNPMQANSFVTFAGESDLVGSKPLPTLASGAILMGPVAPYAAAGHWTLLAVLKMPSTPVAATAMPFRIVCSGTAPTWRIGFAPGSPDTLRVRAEGSSDIPLLDAGIAITEADVYGQWVLVQLSVEQNGGNVDYDIGYLTSGSGVSQAGTLASRTCGAARAVHIAANSDTDGMAVGHVAVYTDPNFNIGSDPTVIAFTALDADTGDPPYQRFRAVCDAAGLPRSVYVDTDIPSLLMGPRLPTTLPAALEECAATDQGLIHDSGPGGSLVLVTRSARYNQTPAMTLDIDQRDLAPPFAPTYTTRDRVSDSTVSRSGGSSARYVDATVRGARSEQVSFSLDSDHYLHQIAGFRSRLSSTPGMRYPQLAINLRDRPELLPAWLTSRIGSRVQVENLWDSHGPNIVDQHIDGSEERFTDRWDVTLRCNPAARFDVPVLEAADDTVFRADLAASTLASGISAVATSISVASAGALISTSGATYPCDVDLGGEQITVTACSGASSPQTLTVTRGQYARAHDAGTPVVLWRGRGVAL